MQTVHDPGRFFEKVVSFSACPYRTVDGCEIRSHHFETMVNPFLAGTYRGIIIPGFLRRRISSIHCRKDRPNHSTQVTLKGMFRLGGLGI